MQNQIMLDIIMYIRDLLVCFWPMDEDKTLDSFVTSSNCPKVSDDTTFDRESPNPIPSIP